MDTRDGMSEDPTDLVSVVNMISGYLAGSPGYRSEDVTDPAAGLAETRFETHRPAHGGAVLFAAHWLASALSQGSICPV
jgi:hypothetical protein